MIGSSHRRLRPRGSRTHLLNQQRSGGGSSANLVSLTIGMLMGCLLMYMVMVPLTTMQHLTTNPADNSADENPLLRSSRPANDNNNNAVGEDGWGTLNVYYGKRGGYLGQDVEDVMTNTIRKGAGVGTTTQQQQQLKQSFAQVHQDEVVNDLISSLPASASSGQQQQQQHYFVDLASNDAKELTNTLGLEMLGWRGLCIEPNPTYWYGLSHRACTVAGALVSGTSLERVDVKFRGVYGGIAKTIDNALANRKKEPDAPTEQRYTVSFQELLTKFKVPTTIDYLSLDVEGAEYMIMQHFPFDKYTIKIMTVERPNKQLKALLEQNGFLFLKDLAWWGETLWAHQSTGYTPSHPKIVKIQTEEKR